MNAPTFAGIALSLLASAPAARGQLRLDWSRTYSTPGIDSAHAVCVDDAGAVYAAGVVDGSSGLVNGRAFVAAWSASGDLLWSTTFDPDAGRAESPSRIALDGAGGVYVVGSIRGATTDLYSGFVLRVQAGAILWSHVGPTTTGGGWSPALLVDAAGRAIVGGRAPSGAGDLEVAAYASDGAVDWRATHAGSAGGVDTVVDLALAPSGEIVAAGTVDRSVDEAPALLCVGADGTIVRALEIDRHLVERGTAAAVAVGADGRIHLAVTGYKPGAGSSSMLLLTFDAEGEFEWSRAIDGPLGTGPGAYAADVVLDVFGRPVVVGGRRQGTAGTALAIAAYDADGVEVWRTLMNDALGGPSFNIWNLAATLVADASGEVTVVGSHGPALADTVSDAFAYVVDSTGTKRHALAYGFPPTSGGSFDHGIGAASAGAGSIVIAGRAQTSSGSSGFDAFVARFTRSASGYCHGDAASVACPCGNASADVERAGCSSSLGVGGRLADRGMPSLSADTLALVGSSLTGAMTLYFQGTSAIAPAVFGDGVLCTGGSIVRLGTVANVAGASSFPGAIGVPVSVRGHVAAPGERFYQAQYRNAAPFCTSASFNTTNAMRVTWGP